MNNRIVYFAVILLFSFLFCLSGCQNPDSLTVIHAETTENSEIQTNTTEKPEPTQTTPTPAPQETPHTSPASSPQVINSEEQSAEFLTQDGLIYKLEEGIETVLYDPSEYNKSYSKCSVKDLIVEDDTLFISEWCGGEEHDNEGDYLHSIIRLDKDGNNKQVLVSMQSPWGYQNLISFQDRLIYLIESGDSYSIRDISKDGTDTGLLDFDSYSAKHDAYTGFGYVDFYNQGEYLYAAISLYLKDGSDETHHIRIDKYFNIERILPE